MADNKKSKFYEFKTDIPEQAIAVEFLNKIRRRQVDFISKLICEYLSKYGISTLSEIEKLSKKEALSMIQHVTPPGVIIRSESNTETQQAMLGLMTALTASLTGNLPKSGDNATTNVVDANGKNNTEESSSLTAEEENIFLSLGEYLDT